MRYLLVTVFVTSMTSLSKYMDEWKDLSQLKQQRIAQVCVFQHGWKAPIYMHETHMGLTFVIHVSIKRIYAIVSKLKK